MRAALAALFVLPARRAGVRADVVAAAAAVGGARLLRRPSGSRSPATARRWPRGASRPARGPASPGRRARATPPRSAPRRRLVAPTSTGAGRRPGRLRARRRAAGGRGRAARGGPQRAHERDVREGPRSSAGSTAGGSRDVSLAAAPSGDAALAWFEDRGTRTDRVYVSLRRAHGRFGAPRRLATGRIRSVAAAVGASGDVLVAWDARGVLRTRFKPRQPGELPRHGHDPLRGRLLRRAAPGRHAQRPRGARLERAVRQRGRRQRPGVLPGGGAPVRRGPLPARGAARAHARRRGPRAPRRRGRRPVRQRLGGVERRRRRGSPRARGPRRPGRPDAAGAGRLRGGRRRAALRPRRAAPAGR